MDDELRRRAFISSLTFDINLEGLPIREKLSVADLHIPRVRRSPYSDAPVSHLDVVSCWKGLSYSQATELIIWERLFQQCLALQIRKRLQGIVIKHLDEVQKPANESVLLPQLVECLREKRPYRVGIDITTLIRDIIEAFYREYYDETARPYFAWSQGCGNLPRFLYNFLRTQDCFLHTHSGECLTVDLLIPSHTDTFITLIANLAWQPPEQRRLWIAETILSSHIVTYFPEGVRFERTSRYLIKLDVVHSEPVGDASATHHHIRRPDSPMEAEWMPSYTSTPLSKTGQNSPKRNENGFSSQMSNSRDAGLHGDVEMGEDDSEAHHTELPATTPQRLNTLCQSPTKRKASQGQHPSSSQRANSESLNDRNVDTDHKRRKLRSGVNPDALANVLPSASPEYQHDSLPLRLGIPQATCDLESMQKAANAQRTDCSPRRMSEANGSSPMSSLSLGDSVTFPGLKPQHHRHTSPKSNGKAKTPHLNSQQATTTAPAAYRDPTPDHTDSDNSTSAPDTSPPLPPPATATGSTTYSQLPPSTELLLSQEQIQQNYVEFAERAQRKAAEKAYYATTIPNFDGIVSPTDEVDKSFEEAFLADSDADSVAEEWSTELEGLSEEMETLDMA
ncbi:hypothetical protein N0V83_000322 [Neocucurbitaria cava]|uniref:Uncharacterized protein n=1 Tax=Neocucurbitaria cava TaxID=798079 RepID=A0A9W9CRW3_9PLEO|nr:hypothetical protein N0V83_000322 [Neocucurbitaria cava]